MTADWQKRLEHWVEAGLLNREQAERILGYERAAGATGTSLLTNIVWSLGAVLLAAGILLLVSAHWDDMSPALRFLCVLAMIAVLHGGAAAAAHGRPALSHTLHAAGTAALGAGVYLAAQIFNLAEHWPGGILLWAIGAVCGWLLLRHWSQLLWVAVLVPMWLGAEWVDYADRPGAADLEFRLLGYFATLLSVAYLSLGRSGERDPNRRALALAGALTLVPSASALFFFYGERTSLEGMHRGPVEMAALIATFALPLVPVWLAKRRIPAGNFIATAWGIALMMLELFELSRDRQYGWHESLSTYAMFAAGGFGLVVWGLRDSHRSRINLGVAVFAGTVFAFYFSSIYDKLGRGLGLIIAGLLFIGGGWWLERTRRRLVARVGGGKP
jgi:uncharacterized membrane protein